jgi:2,3-bisphosphoglycerate-independent phosphoglycerate mutase
VKYAIIIPDGAADEPLEQLGGKTPFEVANIPNMDQLAKLGRLGMVRTVPDGFESGSDVATLCLLGYPPSKYHCGRAPLEAAAQRIALSPTDWVFRCNLVTVKDGIMKDHSAGGITNADARILLKLLSDNIKIPGIAFYPGVSYRNLMVYRGDRNFNLNIKPPHDFPEEPEEKYTPKGEGADILLEIINKSKELFANHPINQKHRDKKINQATQVWLWGQGHAPDMPSFRKRFGVKKCGMITAVDLLRGLGTLMGWDQIPVPGMTSYHDTNYIGQGEHTIAALDQCDLVLSHIEAPDEASHQADWKTKIAAIEHIDKYIVGPVFEKMKSFPEWRMMVLPDHPTLVRNRKHGYDPTPYAQAGSNIKAGGFTDYCEKSAKKGKMIDPGDGLMEYFLRG